MGRKIELSPDKLGAYDGAWCPECNTEAKLSYTDSSTGKAGTPCECGKTTWRQEGKSWYAWYEGDEADSGG